MAEVGGKNEYSIDEGLEAAGFGAFQWILCILSGIGFCATTVELISVSLLRVPLQAAWPEVSNERFALIMSSTFAGELIGGLAWGAISDRMGRRTSFICTALMAAIFGLMASISPNFYFFAACRFFLGIAIGMEIKVFLGITCIGGSLAVDFVYFIEFVPATARGFRTTFIIFLGICACKSP